MLLLMSLNYSADAQNSPAPLIKNGGFSISTSSSSIFSSEPGAAAILGDMAALNDNPYFIKSLI